MQEQKIIQLPWGSEKGRRPGDSTALPGCPCCPLPGPLLLPDHGPASGRYTYRAQDKPHGPATSNLFLLSPLLSLGSTLPLNPPRVLVCVCACARVHAEPCVYLCPQEDAQRSQPHIGMVGKFHQDLRGMLSKKHHGKVQPRPREPEASLFLDPLLT